MASSYAAFEVKIDNDDGTSTLLPLQVVHVYDVDGLTELTDVVAGVDGVVAAGSLAVDPGTLIRFHFAIETTADPDFGVCGYSEIYTT